MKRKSLAVIIIILLLMFSWGSYQYFSISRVGGTTRPQQADVIIVLGAAVWAEGPSPALEARVKYAAHLYREGFADNLILTGGLGVHPPTEARVMKEVLKDLEVEREALYLEERAENTLENIKYSKEIMDGQDWESALIVSDYFHIKRALLIAEDLGIEEVHGAPAQNSPLYQNPELRLLYTSREVLAYTSYLMERKLNSIISADNLISCSTL